MISRFIPARLRFLYMNETVERWFPRWVYARRKSRWLESWAEHDYTPSWMSAAIPAELLEAVTTGWFAPECPLLDIGCGNGDIAAWLAESGHQVDAVDFAPAALEKARALHPEHDRLTFRATDIVCDHLPTARYGALIDRGCFHVIPRSRAQDYAANVAASAAPGARFLLVHAVDDRPREANAFRWYPDATAEEVIAFVRGCFEASFEVERTASASFGVTSHATPAVAFWMTRR